MARKADDAPRQAQDAQAQETGLFVVGRVLERRVRVFTGKDNIAKDVISYRVLAGNEVHFVDDWSGVPAFHVGEEVRIQVYVRAFAGRRGPMYGLTRCQPQEVAIDAR